MRTILGAAGLLAMVATAALADDTTSERAPSALAETVEAIIAEDADTYAALGEERSSVEGLRCWTGSAPRKANRYDSFARPITNLDFHHPFIWNELRPLVMYQHFPRTSAVAGGRARIAAMQIHVAVSDDVQITAYKDGYADLEAAGLPNGTGFVDIAVGPKVKVWEDDDALATAAVGVTYETKTGAKDVLQGTGSGIFDVFGSYARAMDGFNIITTAGIKLPTDSDDDPSLVHAHAHVDVPLTESLSGVLEANGYHYLDDAERNLGLGPTVPLPVEGFDLTSIGAGDVEGDTVVSLAFGFRWFASEDVSFGAAYEWSATDREHLLENRLTFDLVLRF